MSYHDKSLSVAGKIAKRMSTRRAMLRGIGLISLSPRAPDFRFGSIESDFRAVGNDMRRALVRVRAE